MTSILPWANGPFELLVHAEAHLREGGDFDRRIALISFDNAIEVAITTYLALHPIQRGGREYNNQDVTRWLNSYHSRLDFLEFELKSRKASWVVEKSHIVWVHRQRNEQYHGGGSGVPEENVIDTAREASAWVFSFLFDVSDIETEIENAILDRSPTPVIPLREERLDEVIDTEYGIIEIGEQVYLASDLLYAIDYDAYRDLGELLNSS